MPGVLKRCNQLKGSRHVQKPTQILGIPHTKKPAKKDAAQNADPTAADVPVAKKYLERVVREHPNTPWAMMAQSELDFPLDFSWQETFIEPPDGEKLPWDKVPWDKLTDEQKKFVKKYNDSKKKRQQRAKKREEIKGRVPPKL